LIFRLGQEGGDGSQTGGDNQQGNENKPEGENNPGGVYYPDAEGAAGNGTETGIPPKKGMSWLPIIIIAASIVGLLLIGLLILFLRKKNRTSGGKGYNAAATSEPAAGATRT